MRPAGALAAGSTKGSDQTCAAWTLRRGQQDDGCITRPPGGPRAERDAGEAGPRGRPDFLCGFMS